MAASDNLNPQQFEKYGGGYYTKPKNVEPIEAVASQPRYAGLANAATRAAQAASNQAVSRTRRKSA